MSIIIIVIPISTIIFYCGFLQTLVNTAQSPRDSLVWIAYGAVYISVAILHDLLEAAGLQDYVSYTIPLRMTSSDKDEVDIFFSNPIF